MHGSLRTFECFDVSKYINYDLTFPLFVMHLSKCENPTHNVPHKTYDGHL